MKYRVAVMFITACSMAATLHVPAEYPTIQEAIEASVDGDSVVVSPGFYYETVDFLGKSITLKSVFGALETTIHNTGPYCVVFIQGTAGTAVLDGFTINSNYTYPGVVCENSNVILSRNIIRNNLGYPGDWGGGVDCSQCSVSLLDNLITGNEGGGGAQLRDCSGTIANNKFVRNRSLAYQQGGRGGALYIDGIIDTLQVRNNLFILNESPSYVGYPWPSSGYGGGLYIQSSDPGHAMFVNNTFSGNTSMNGGGICLNSAASVELVNCILWDDEASGECHEILLVGGAEAAISYSDVEQYTNPEYVSGGVTIGDGVISDTPMFVVGTYSNFQLDEGFSPCIDAGNPDPSFNDPEDPANPGYALYPSLGLLRNDMGTYGGGGVGYWVGIAGESSPPLESPELAAFPNPFTAVTSVVFHMPVEGRADLLVFDVSGRLVETLAEGDFAAGPHTAFLSGTDLPAGMYVVRFHADGSTSSLRVILLR